MAGAQLATRWLYPVLGPRRHITAGLAGVAVSIGLLGLLGPGTSLWWARLLMLTLGLAMGQVFVPVQVAAFATITPAATGRASTMFNTVRQLGGAIGVAVLTTDDADAARTIPQRKNRPAVPDQLETAPSLAD